METIKENEPVSVVEPVKAQEPEVKVEAEKVEEKVDEAAKEVEAIKSEEPVVVKEAEPANAVEPTAVSEVKAAESEKVEEKQVEAEAVRPEEISVKVEEPVKVLEQVHIEEPVKSEEQAKAEEPVKVAEPVKSEELVKADESAKVEEPVKAAEPAKDETPTKKGRSSLFSFAARKKEMEAAKAAEPSKDAAEPAKSDSPTDASEPAKEETPTKKKNRSVLFSYASRKKEMEASKPAEPARELATVKEEEPGQQEEAEASSSEPKEVKISEPAKEGGESPKEVKIAEPDTKKKARSMIFASDKRKSSISPKEDKRKSMLLPREAEKRVTVAEPSKEGESSEKSSPKDEKRKSMGFRKSLNFRKSFNFKKGPEIQPSEASSVPIIFLHGLKGATLQDASGGTYFINMWQGLGISSPSLSLPMEWEGSKQKEDGLKGGKIIDSIAYMQIYGPFLKYLETLGRPVYPWAYDWRRDLNETAEKLQEFIREIYTKHNSKVQLISHSMGGLVCLAAINTHNGMLVGKPATGTNDVDNFTPTPEDPGTVPIGGEENKEGLRVIDILHSVVFAGAPFRTGVGFLPDMMIGAPNGMNHKILAPHVLFTFPAVYTFFPRKENSQIINEKGENIPIDFYDANDWINYRMGIFSKIDQHSAAQKAHLEKCCAQAKLLRSKLVALDVDYPPIAVLAGHKHPTTQKFKLINGKIDFVNVIIAMGDHTMINSTPADGIPYTEYETDKDHVGLLNDLPTVSKILKDLNHLANLSQRYAEVK